MAAIEPEVLQKMTITELKEPDPKEFAPRLLPEEIALLEGRDKQIVFHMSSLEQKIDWLIKQTVTANGHARQSEAAIIRLAIRQDKVEEAQTKLNWKGEIAKWCGVTAGAGIVASVIRKFLG